jgi:hypothetical protein
MVTTDLLWLISYFEQCQAANKAAGILEKIAKDKKQQKKRKRWLIFPSCAALNQATGSIVTISGTIIKATNAMAMTNNATIIIKAINATNILVAMTRTIRATSPMRRRMIASVNFKIKSDKAMHNNQSSLSSADTLSKKVVTLPQDLLHALVPILALAWVAGATTTIMCLMMIASWAHSLSAGTRTPPRAMTADTSIALTRLMPCLLHSPL